MDDALRKKLSTSVRLPSMPVVAVKLIKLLEQGDASPNELAEIIRLDVALSARILSVANSTLFRGVSTVETVLQAVTSLGMDRCVSLALGFSLRSSIQQEDKSGLDYELFWRRSLLVASSAKVLALVADTVPAEPAFLVGLLQDIGIIVLDKVDQDFYQALGPVEQREHQKLMNYERTRLGSDHCEVGAWLLNHWQLPELYVDAVRYSGQNVYEENYGSSVYGPLIAVANELADLILPVSSGNCLDNMNYGMKRHFHIDDNWSALYAETLATHIAEVEQIFEQMLLLDVDLGELLGSAQELKERYRAS